MTNDPIADMLTRIRNAISRGYKSVSIPHSNMLESFVKILEETGFVNGYTLEEGNNPNRKIMIVSLKYVNGENAIREMKRISKPGLRIYKKYKDINKYKKGIGISVLSTSKGIMTGKQAVEQKIGGEVLATLW